MLLVGIMIIVSMLAFSKLMQRLGDLQIGNVLQLVGDQGRGVIADMFRPLDAATAAPRASEAIAGRAPLGPLTQTVSLSASPAPSPGSTSFPSSPRRGRRAGQS